MRVSPRICRAAGNLALISQSGAIAAGMVDWAAQRAVGFSGIVSIGDQLDVDIADLLDYFALDARRAPSCSISKRSRTPANSCRRRAPPQGSSRSSSSNPAAWRRAQRRPRPTPARWRARTRSMTPRSGAPASCGYRICANCSTAPRRWGASKSPPGKRLAILTNGGGIGVLAVDRLVELGGIPADDRARGPRRSSMRCCRRHGPDRIRSTSSATPTPRAMRRRSRCCWPIPAMTPSW